MKETTWVIFFLGISLAILLSASLFFASNRKEHRPSARFFMPTDLFIYLILLINYWVMLLILLESKTMNQESTIAIIASAIFAPFLNWWHKKRVGE